MRRIIFPILLMMLVFCSAAYAQQTSLSVSVDYEHPRKYILGGVRVKGIKYLGEQQIIALTGLQEGSEITIPSDQTASIVTRIWGQRHFSEVSLNIDSVSAMQDTVWLALHLQERPRVSRWSFQGV